MAVFYSIFVGLSLSTLETGNGATMDLKGKVAFVTGGSGDIGSGIAAALARAGAHVAVSYVGHREGADPAE